MYTIADSHFLTVMVIAGTFMIPPFYILGTYVSSGASPANARTGRQRHRSRRLGYADGDSPSLPFDIELREIRTAMTYKRKTWREKAEDDKGFPKIIRYSPALPCGKTLKKLGAKTGDRVVLAPPSEVREIMRGVPKGELVTLNEICARLARKHGTGYCCTLTTGIMVMTAANAAAETGDPLPYWRTIKNDGELNAKYPGGAEAHGKLLEEEGYTVLRKGKKLFVGNHDAYVNRTV